MRRLARRLFTLCSAASLGAWSPAADIARAFPLRWTSEHIRRGVHFAGGMWIVLVCLFWFLGLSNLYMLRGEARHVGEFERRTTATPNAARRVEDARRRL